MKFISAEEFLKQDKEVQKVFIDWWKPSIGDLIYISHFEVDGIEIDNDPIIYALKDKWDCSTAKEDPPLLTEGQLRQFIEDKTGKKVIFEYTCCENIVIKLLEQNKVSGSLEFKDKFIFQYNQINLLQAYWKVALVIAKECVG